ncbi:MAG: hypothetical protein R6X18_05585 [Chloroflexota bacterium]
MTTLSGASLRRVFFALLAFGLLTVATGASPVLAQSSPPGEGEGRFGVIESYEDPEAAGRLGAAWTRVRFQWADVQAEGPEAWALPLEDEDLAIELAAGREVAGLIIGIPDWARDRNGLPRGLDLPPDDPGNTWAVFVRDLVDRYDGRINHWIIWNEPDIADADAPGHTWDGSMEEFFQLQKTAYLVAKETNPEAVIHLGAFTYFWDPGYFRRFLDLVATDPDAAENDYYFDIATAHLYFQPGMIYNIIDLFYRAMAAYNLDQPIWLVETNAPPMDDPYWLVPDWTLAVSLNEQAAFIPQALATALAAGAERVAVYKLKDTPGDRFANPEPFGLLRWDQSRRPAFDTYRVAIRRLEDVTTAERERWDEVGQIRLEQPGRTTTVLFARLPQSQTARVGATADTAELVDMWGKTEIVDAEAGYFTVDLPGALCLHTIADYCMIGGTTYYLIQDLDYERPATPPPPTLAVTRPVPAGTPTPSPTPKEISPAPTPTATAMIIVAAVQSEPTLELIEEVTPNVETLANEMETSLPAADSISWVGNYAGFIFIGLVILLAAAIVGRYLASSRG